MEGDTVFVGDYSIYLGHSCPVRLPLSEPYYHGPFCRIVYPALKACVRALLKSLNPDDLGKHLILYEHL